VRFLALTLLSLQSFLKLFSSPGAKKKGEKWIEETVKNWGNLHSVRILLRYLLLSFSAIFLPYNDF